MKSQKKKKFRLVQENFPQLPLITYILSLRRMLADCRTILDLGCGASSPIRYIDGKTLGCDLNKSLIKSAIMNRTHDSFKIEDVTKINNFFKPKSFEAVVALDVIEHLPKMEGKKFIKTMESIASKKIIIFTPNGFLPNKLEDLDEHLSGWTVEEMEAYGFRVFGMYGYKGLRCEGQELRFKPKFFWGIISEITQWVYTWYNPRHAAAIFCIKDIKS